MVEVMDGRDEMRAADSDREAVAERLRAALNDGRLDLHEYDDRLQRAYAAKTYGELGALLGDLPGSVPSAGVELAPLGPSEVAAADPTTALSGSTRRWLGRVWAPYLNVVGLVTAPWAVVSVLSDEFVYFWPAWVAGPWGAVLLVRTVNGLAGGEPARWAATRDRKRMAKADRRARRRAAREVD